MPGSDRRRGGKLTKRRRLMLLATIVAGTMTATLGATGAKAALEAFPGSPLSVFIGPLGECQSSYSLTGVNYYVGEQGDCGFFLAFPDHEKNPQASFLAKKTFGFPGNAGPHLSAENEYVPVSQTPVEGAGTAASPYTQTTVFEIAETKEEEPTTVFAKITDVTTYLNGAAQFASKYTVTNETATTIYFRAIYAGDLYVAGNDFGVGSFGGVTPHFVGGLNTAEGILGGFIEETPWSAWEEGCWNDGLGENTGRCQGDAANDAGIWTTVRAAGSKETGSVFNDFVDPAQIDNGVGVEWDAPLAGLAAKAEDTFTVINHTEAPAGLTVSPANQTLTQGQTEAISVSAVNTAGNPYAGATVRYTVAGSNPQTGAVTLNGAGQGTISYLGTNAGADTIQMYLDLANDGTQSSTDPSATAAVTWLPASGAYTVKSVHANSDGTITIVFVPVQSGTATLEVTVPTASISRTAQAAKAKKCKKSQIRIHGKCRPKTTVTGKVKKAGAAGVPLTITVKASRKVKAALKKGHTVHLTVKLTYKSAFGGTPTVHVYHVTAKPKKKKGHH